VVKFPERQKRKPGTVFGKHSTSNYGKLTLGEPGGFGPVRAGEGGYGARFDANVRAGHTGRHALLNVVFESHLAHGRPTGHARPAESRAAEDFPPPAFAELLHATTKRSTEAASWHSCANWVGAAQADFFGCRWMPTALSSALAPSLIGLAQSAVGGAANLSPNRRLG
jgi:hypothetical protein